MSFVPLSVLEKSRTKVRVDCIPEPVYFNPPHIALKFLMSRIADIQKLLPAFQSQLVDLAVMLQNEQSKIEAIFREISVYDHCQSYGCCVSMVPSYYLSSPEVELNAALMVKEAKSGKRVVSTDDKINSLCQFLDRTDFHCGLPLKPWKCITYRGCVQDHVTDLEQAVSDYFGLRKLLDEEVRSILVPENERLFARLDQFRQGNPDLNNYFDVREK
jgi:hypothetical protein